MSFEYKGNPREEASIGGLRASIAAFFICISFFLGMCFQNEGRLYESEAENRRKTAYILHHEKGLKWREVAEKMNTTEHAVKALAKRYKQIDQDTRG